jgi:predicted SAM-dependent methyltransferase
MQRNIRPEGFLRINVPDRSFSNNGLIKKKKN